MTPTPCRVAGCIISIRPIRIYALVHLLTYLYSWLGRIKPVISPVEDRVKVTNLRTRVRAAEKALEGDDRQTDRQILRPL